MKYLIIFIAFATSMVSVAMAQQPEKEEMQFLIIEALTKNPEIAADLQKMQAADQRITQAGALDNPELIFKLMEVPGTEFNQAMYANIELMQMVRFPTKLSTQKQIATVQAEHAHHDHLEKMLEIVSQMKSAYAMLWYARTALELNKDNQKYLEQILKVAGTQYSVGRTSQQDVLKTSIELAKLKTQEMSLRQDAMSAESMLRSLLNRPSTAAVGEVSYGETFLQTPPINALVNFAFANRPMLIHDSLSIYESSLSLDLMKQEYIPDLKLSVEYVRLPALAENRWSIAAGITLPFAPWTLAKSSSRVEEATAMRSMSEYKYVASRRMVEAQIRDAYSKTTARLAEVTSLEKTILPQTRQSLQILMSEYQTGQTSYLMLLDGYRMYKETRMEAAMARMRYEQAKSTLERQVGVTDLVAVPFALEEKTK
ncbi:MAG: TolC family protein [Ignavibacteriales bacterium]|nr:TolC family protein [Ignavibacteriales bacterium]